MGNAYTFGNAQAHRSNQSIKVLELRDGQYFLAYPGWIRLQAPQR
jgi:branched-chain amino acid transport system substrate-binding protein